MTDSNLALEMQTHMAAMTEMVNQCGPVIHQIALALEDAFKAGHKLLLCGNGGSAADAQHVAGEFVNRFRFDRPPLPAIALTTDSSVLTCIGNDSSFVAVFSKQVEALGKAGDVLVAISTSGKSPNVLAALDRANKLGMITIGLTSEKGARPMSAFCDLILAVPSDDTARIQECHEFAWHYICGAVEEELFGAKL